MGFFNSFFKSKEEKEKERIERELQRKKQEEIEMEYKQKAWIEAEKITEQLKKDIKEFSKEYGNEYFYISYDTSYLKDEKLKIYTTLAVINNFEIIFGFYEYKEIELLFDNKAEKSKYYHKFFIEDPSHPNYKDEELCKEKGMYYSNGKPVDIYYIKSIKFERFYEGYEFIVLKNRIYYSFDGSREFMKGDSSGGRNTYDRGGLLMNR